MWLIFIYRYEAVYFQDIYKTINDDDDDVFIEHPRPTKQEYAMQCLCMYLGYLYDFKTQTEKKKKSRKKPKRVTWRGLILHHGCTGSMTPV